MMRQGKTVWPERAKVLVIDDEEGMRNILSKVLTKEGYDVLTAESGERALEIVRADEVDLALVDLKMPGIGGIETIRRIKEINKGISLIIITAFGEMRSVKEATKLGAFDYITKPLDIDYVVALVKHVSMSTRPRNLPFAEDLKKKFTGGVEIAPKQEAMKKLSMLKQDVEVQVEELKGSRAILVKHISSRHDSAIMSFFYRIRLVVTNTYFVVVVICILVGAAVSYITNIIYSRQQEYQARRDVTIRDFYERLERMEDWLRKDYEGEERDRLHRR